MILKNIGIGRAIRIVVGMQIFAILLLAPIIIVDAKSIRDDATGGDCYTIGTWDISTNTCTLTADLMGSDILIESDGITLDGDGHLLIFYSNYSNGSTCSNGAGVCLSGRTGVTVKNIRTEQPCIWSMGACFPVDATYEFGIYVYESKNINLTMNTIGAGYNDGMELIDSNNSNISDNIVGNCCMPGLSFILNGSNNTIFRNRGGGSDHGSSISGSNNILIGNFFSGYEVGLHMGGSDNLIKDNYFSGHQVYALDFYGGSNNKFYQNDINGPGPSVFVPSVNQWDNGIDTGNHYTRYDEPVEGCNDIDNNNICDSPLNLSDGNIDRYPLVSATYIRVKSPNGEENWERGTIHAINWNYSGSPGTNVKIELLKNGVVNHTITLNTSIGSGGSGSYNWLIKSTQTPGTDYKIRVTSAINSAYNDTSNINFTISAPTPKTGDINGNGQLTLVDAIYLAKHVGGFSGYETIYDDGDINANGQVTLVDAIYLAKHVGGFIGYEKIY